VRRAPALLRTKSDELQLERADTRAYCRLRYMQALCGCDETTAGRNGTSEVDVHYNRNNFAFILNQNSFAAVNRSLDNKTMSNPHSSVVRNWKPARDGVVSSTMGISRRPQGPALSDEQWNQLDALTGALDSSQLFWVSGFLAGVGHGRKVEGVTPWIAEHRVSESAGTVTDQRRPLTILYGSETGNSATVARTLATYLGECGHRASLHDMADYKVRQVGTEKDLLIVTSTYGEGEPPQAAAAFFEFVEGTEMFNNRAIPG
jgi:Flavodoxin